MVFRKIEKLMYYCGSTPLGYSLKTVNGAEGRICQIVNYNNELLIYE